MKLRSALNDNAENPVFIETVPRRGYRFIAPVEIVEVEATPLMTAIRIENENDRESVELPLDGDRPVEETKPKQFKWSDLKAGLAWWQVIAMAAGLVAGEGFFFFSPGGTQGIEGGPVNGTGRGGPRGGGGTEGRRKYFLGRGG